MVKWLERLQTDKKIDFVQWLPSLMDGAGVFVSFLNKLVMVPMFDWLSNSQGVILILRLALWAPDKYFKSAWQKT